MKKGKGLGLKEQTGCEGRADGEMGCIPGEDTPWRLFIRK